jgi:hypothetical protein
MFIAALFTIIKLWNQPRNPTPGEGIKKMLQTHTHTHNGILLSYMKNASMSFAGKWMELKIITLSMINQAQKVK